MDIVLIPLLQVLRYALDLYMYVVIAYVAFSWLKAFGIVNTWNRAVATIDSVLVRLTEPILRLIRSIIPTIGGIDLSPMLLIFLLFFLQGVATRAELLIIVRTS